ncbi:thioredoxin-like protein [Geopyxis carbonaria]|nr:thioredoxin-like protein [Geopyxis carbonaria]
MSALFRRCAAPLARRSFHSSTPLAIKAGESFPEISVFEDSPGNSVSLAQELKKHSKAIVIGVPAAYSPACSSTHIPGWIKANSGLPTYVVSVNDPFVMKAWGLSLPGSKDAGFRFMADSSGALTRALDMEFDSAAIFGNNRGKRYVLTVENGKVAKVFVEPDNTGVKGEIFYGKGVGIWNKADIKDRNYGQSCAGALKN